VTKNTDGSATARYGAIGCRLMRIHWAMGLWVGRNHDFPASPRRWAPLGRVWKSSVQPGPLDGDHYFPAGAGAAGGAFVSAGFVSAGFVAGAAGAAAAGAAFASGAFGAVVSAQPKIPPRPSITTNIPNFFILLSFPNQAIPMGCGRTVLQLLALLIHGGCGLFPARESDWEKS
jgi:hypothetical protein